MFGAPSIDFLGQRVTAGGVTPLPTYVSSVLDFPRPNTVKEVQGFLGLLISYRRFLPAVARTLQPLTGALRSDRKGAYLVEWSAAMEAVFTASKKALSSATFLAHPLPGAVLSLSVDASATHIGAGLHQRRPGSVVREALGVFSKETGACADQVLCLRPGTAGVFFRHPPFPAYARGATVHHFHRPLTSHLCPQQGFRPMDRRQACQLSYVAEYTSDIRHVAGVNNVVADTLSQLPAIISSSATPGAAVPA